MHCELNSQTLGPSSLLFSGYCRVIWTQNIRLSFSDVGPGSKSAFGHCESLKQPGRLRMHEPVTHDTLLKLNSKRKANVLKYTVDFLQTNYHLVQWTAFWNQAAQRNEDFPLFWLTSSPSSRPIQWSLHGSGSGQCIW